MAENKSKKTQKVAHIEDDTFAKGKKKEKQTFEDEVIRVFDPVIDSDEKIVKAYKPNKAKILFSNLVFGNIPFVLLMIIAVLMVAFPGEEEMLKSDVLVVLLVPGIVMIVAIAVNIWFSMLYYKNTYYAVTNKRLIVCTGIFGVDYKSLDIQSVGASDVYVGLTDKILKKNTGSIKFGSNSSPINSESKAYMFAHVDNPYETYKEIKKMIEDSQKQ